MPKDRYEDQELDNRYYLQRLLDTGSFGAVYEARDLKLGRIVAVKILFDQDESAFRKEAKLAVQFEHPNVVKVFDYGADDKLNVGYIVMEFLNGRRLDQLITALSGRVTYPTIAKFAFEIGSALQLAHDRQLIHRDLKPRNVMLVDDGTPQERFVLLDLGLASQMNSTSTLRNQTLDGALSPHYASPEQFGQGAVDFRSDIYSFGTILYELVTGQIPFPRDQLLGLMMAICNEPPPRMIDVAPDREVPEDLEAIVGQCLCKDPAARPESIRVVRDKVLQVLTAAPTIISPHTVNFARGDTDHSGIPLRNVPFVGTGTMLPPGEASDQSRTAEIPSWKESARLGSLRRQPEWKRRRQTWTTLFAAIVILVPLAWFAADRLRRPQKADPDPVPDPVPVVNAPETRGGQLILPSELSVSSGKSTTLQTYVQAPVPHDENEPLSIRVGSYPPWLKVDIPESPPFAEMFIITVTADPSVQPRSAELTLTAEAGAWSEQKTVQIRLQATEPWKPPEGFEPTPDSVVLTSADGRTFYRSIVRVVDADLRVEFLLIDPPRAISGGRIIPPFYIMRDMVWNKLFETYWRQFAEKGPTADSDSSWKLGATSGGKDLGTADYPLLPTVRVTAMQAHRFAVWLTAGRGHLPSMDQWNLASGLKQRSAASAEDQLLYPEGPYLGTYGSGNPAVAVNRRREGPLPVGTSADDISINGVRDMAGNAQELTETLINGGRVGDVQAHEVGGSLLRVLLRGRSYLNSRPLTWEEIESSTDIPDAIGYTESDPTIGFRVVLETVD